MPGGVVPPLSLVLEWQTDKFPHGFRAGSELTILSVICMVLALSVVGARLYDRFLVRHSGGIDDWLIMVALIPTVAVGISVCVAEQLCGFDRHAWDLTPELAIKSRKVTLAIVTVYLYGTGLTKISILCFYRRMGGIRPWFKWTIWINIVFVILSTLAFSLVIPLECTPTNAYWYKVNPFWAYSHKWHCINEGAKMTAAGAVSAFQDVLACIIPMAIFWDLRITRRAKISLGFVFSLGIVTVIAGIIRTIKIYNVFYKTYDATWAARPAFSWAMVEACLGLICASIPALKTRLQHIIEVTTKQFSSSGGSHKWTNPFFRTLSHSFSRSFGKSSRDFASSLESGKRTADDRPSGVSTEGLTNHPASIDGMIHYAREKPLPDIPKPVAEVTWYHYNNFPKSEEEYGRIHELQAMQRGYRIRR